VSEGADAEARAQRVAFGAANTWARRVDQICSLPEMSGS
jgi:hypothetical protein